MGKTNLDKTNVNAPVVFFFCFFFHRDKMIEAVCRYRRIIEHK